MKCKALETIRSYGMLQSGNVLLALSGGADSMALLHLLYSLQEEFQFTLEAAHVNHGIRGKEADADEQFVRNACEALNVPLHVLHANIPMECAETGEGHEECGRRIRYAYFHSVAKGEIATAHTLSDNCETVLMHLARGCGLHGLCGIPPIRGSVIRPLIACTRQDIERYCGENHIAYVTDQSNDSDVYMRNRIRHQVVPCLQEINSSFEATMARSIKLFSSDESFFTEQTQDLLQRAKVRFGWDVSVLKCAHSSVRSRAIAEILRSSMQTEPLMRHIRLCEDLLRLGGKVQTDKSTIACVYGNVFYLEKPKRASWMVPVQGNEVPLPFGKAKISIVDLENIQFVHKQDLANCICCDTIDTNLWMRSRMEGDTFSRVNSGCTKKIKKLFEEQGVPSCFRNDIPILTDGENLLWVEGFGANSKFAITNQSKKAMKIEIFRE